jgi:hypothetical protein
VDQTNLDIISPPSGDFEGFARTMFADEMAEDFPVAVG